MTFLHPFTRKSRTILTAIIRMAKELGIHTLAEGIETKEQADFLREIGCEKMQGFYCGKLLPEEEACERRQDRSLKIETMQEALLFSQAGLIDVSRVLPVAIVFDDGQDVRILQCNAAYRKTLRSTGTKNLADSNHFLSAPDFPMRQKFRRFINKAKASGQTESMTYVDNGQYLRLKLKTIAKVRYKAGMSIAGINNALACLTDRTPSARCSRAMASNPRPPFLRISVLRMSLGRISCITARAINIPEQCPEQKNRQQKAAALLDCGFFTA